MTWDRILLDHGSGGKSSHELVEEVFLPHFKNEFLNDLNDSAVFELDGARLAFTTDSYVVDPIFFPGGDIGRLAVSGTDNDLLTAAARPLALSASFIIEEGLEIKALERIAQSMRETAAEGGAAIITGDTKVVPRGSADKVFITTTGVGEVLRPGITGAAVRPGDKIILTGSVGDHGATVMIARENLLEGTSLSSDVAPLTEIVLNLLEQGCEIHAMRDPTRGGIAASLNEIARQSQVCLEIEESAVKVRPGVAAACEALGLDVFKVANEGKMLIFVASGDAEKALALVRASRYGQDAEIIGAVQDGPPGRVQVRTSIGTARILDPPSGELLPRIC